MEISVVPGNRVRWDALRPSRRPGHRRESRLGQRSGRPDQDGATAGQMPGNCCSEDQRDPGIPYCMRVARGLLCDVRDRRD